MRLSGSDDNVVMATCMVDDDDSSSSRSSNSHGKSSLLCVDDRTGSLPVLAPVSDNEESSSLDSSTSSHHQPPYEYSSSSDKLAAVAAAMNKKRVSWDSIQTREYALVVGDHPFCQDGLPVSLDWQFSDTLARSFQQPENVSERGKSYVFPRRLSYEERIIKLCQVSGLTMEEVKSHEIDLVVKTLKETWESTNIVAPIEEDPLMQDIMSWDDMDCDLADVSDFEWTESL
jgi:hypothetical protein